MGRASPSIVKKLLRAVDSNRFAAPTYWSVLARCGAAGATVLAASFRHQTTTTKLCVHPKWTA
jgi:hypothetical protein